MGEENIRYLLKKYNKSYVPGERRATQTNTALKRNQRMMDKHQVCDELLYECDFFNMSISQKEFVHYLIDTLGADFKKLHGRAKKEAIILAFIFYVKKLEDSRLKIENYSICKKYCLTEEVFILVICRVCDYFVRKSPLPVYETKRYDHEILSKNGGRV